MKNNLGFGVMVNMLDGNEETVKAIKTSLSKKIKKVWLDEESNKLMFEFKDGANLAIRDDGQSCCEYRYMKTDDNLSEFKGAVFLGIEIKDAPCPEDEYGETHEIQFLDIKTDKGNFQMANHNEHNGYYGGFWITAEIEN